MNSTYKLLFICITSITLCNCTFNQKFHKVIFESNGGSKIDTLIVVDKSLVTKPETPTKKNAVFAGWYQDSNFFEKFDFENQRLFNDLRLYANWNQSIIKATFDTRGGQETAPVFVKRDNVLPRPPTPKNGFFVFVGWYTDPKSIKIYDFNTRLRRDITLYAKWKVETYEVSFFDENTDLISIIKYNKGDLVTQTFENKPGFSFQGWYKDFNLTQHFDIIKNVVTQNFKLYAKLVKIHTVQFSNNSGGPKIKDQQTFHGKTIQEPPAPFREGFSLVGWYKNIGLTSPFDFSLETITQDISLYPKWEISTYNVIFEENGGSSVSDEQVVHNDFASRPPVTPTRSGYTFINWYEDFNTTKVFNFNNVHITDDTIIYARWIKK